MRWTRIGQPWPGISNWQTPKDNHPTGPSGSGLYRGWGRICWLKGSLESFSRQARGAALQLPQLYDEYGESIMVNYADSIHVILLWLISGNVIFLFSTIPSCSQGPLAIEDVVKDFLFELGIKPHMHLVKISIFSINNVTVRLTKIMNNLFKHLKILLFQVIFQCWKLARSFQKKFCEKYWTNFY